MVFKMLLHCRQICLPLYPANDFEWKLLYAKLLLSLPKIIYLSHLKQYLRGLCYWIMLTKRGILGNCWLKLHVSL